MDIFLRHVYTLMIERLNGPLETKEIYFNNFAREKDLIMFENCEYHEIKDYSLFSNCFSSCKILVLKGLIFIKNNESFHEK